MTKKNEMVAIQVAVEYIATRRYIECRVITVSKGRRRCQGCLETAGKEETQGRHQEQTLSRLNILRSRFCTALCPSMSQVQSLVKKTTTTHFGNFGILESTDK